MWSGGNIEGVKLCGVVAIWRVKSSVCSGGHIKSVKLCVEVNIECGGEAPHLSPGQTLSMAAILDPLHHTALYTVIFSRVHYVVHISLSKHMGYGKVKLGRGPYAISTAILSMYTGFQHPALHCTDTPLVNIVLMKKNIF